MKKILNSICILSVLLSVSIIASATDRPQYDQTYNNRENEFYIKGIDLIIKEDKDIENMKIDQFVDKEVTTKVTLNDETATLEIVEFNKNGMIEFIVLVIIIVVMVLVLIFV